MELSGSNIKKFLIFQETEISYILGDGNPKKLLIFQEVTFQARKNKKNPLRVNFLFQETETAKKVLVLLLGRFY